jgi:hypothetical protein
VATERVTENSLGAAFSRRLDESKVTIWKPRRIGPRFRWLDRDNIKLVDGRLADREFGIRTDILRNTAELALTDGVERVGEVSIERDPPGKGVVLWDIAVRERLRGNGLAAIMTWCIFREMVQAQETSTFRIRMVRSLKAGEKGVEVQNVGIGVVAARLGFEPELDLAKVLDTRNITDIGVIPKQNGTPPGLRIMLKTAPLVLIAFLLNPDTMKPLSEEGMYYTLSKDRELIRQWALSGRLVISNGNYCLCRAKAERFADILATDVPEARLFRLRVRGL